MDWQTGQKLYYTRNSLHGFPCWIIKVTNKQTIRKLIFNPFFRNGNYSNATQCYVMRTLHDFLAFRVPLCVLDPYAEYYEILTVA